jgi:hypothetical protein
MSENVSSSVLFHFTKSLDNVKNILNNGFFPHYCPEYTFHEDDILASRHSKPPRFAIPLVSFCDLPLSLIGEHLQQYGYFGIGLKKEWGIRNGLAPVIYTHSKAKTRPAISRLLAGPSGGMDAESINDRWFLAAHTKPFRGSAWRNGQVQRFTRFYDEREWRYVPPVQKGRDLFIHFSAYSHGPTRSELEQRYQRDYSLPLTPDDIQYLIVKYNRGEQNVIDLHDFIMRIFSRRFSRRDAILVTTSIMTHDCIRDDI